MTLESATTYVPEDEEFGTPWIDLDEWRDVPERHRFVHGGFEGTQTRFAFYFPPPERWQGRFTSSLEGGVGGHEARAPEMPGTGVGTIPFAFALGAYLVESNNGHIVVGPATSRGTQHGSITTFRATAESARFARHLAREMYGERPHHGYVHGPSGGGWRTILSFENTRGIWDGAVPYISPAGNGMSFPCAIGNLVRVLGPAVTRVVDAWEPGGSANPYEGLDTTQREELAAAYRAGLQPGAEFQLLHPTNELGVLLLTSQMTRDFDPGYFRDFWTVTGYAGADGELERDLIDERLAVTAIVTAGELCAEHGSAVDAVAPDAATQDPSTPVGVRVASGARALSGGRGADVNISSGAGTGNSHRCLGTLGDTLVLDYPRVALAGIGVGDEIHVDNHDYLAYCHAFRHQLDPRSPECAQFTTAGVPIYPQRELGVPDMLAGMPTTAQFDGKMIYVSGLMDTLASPVGGIITYMGRVREAMGAAAPDRLRVWLNDNAGHLAPARRVPGPPPVTDTRLIDFNGSVEHAIRALIAWIEDGVAPAPDSRFDYADGRYTLPATASQRAGIQPVVTASANGAVAATVAVGEPVRLTVNAQVPPGVGRIIVAEWDFDGTGSWPYRHDLDGSASQIEATVEHAFDEPGIYFAAVRVAAHADGDVNAADARVLNLARVRVTVTA